MCGIVGLIDLAHRVGGDPSALAALVSAMRDRLAHRGPDDNGLYVDANTPLALGHRRLSVIDTSTAGHQPMQSAADDGGRFVLCYNGEVYNTSELKERLGSGRSWRGHCDTEVVLAWLSKFGAPGLKDLNGMFALALWDRQRRELLLARDRFGKKPLYYTIPQIGCDWFAFASELTPLTMIPWQEMRLDEASVAVYLLLQYVQAPRTIYEGICKLPPGSFMKVKVERDGVRLAEVESFWDWQVNPAEQQNQRRDESRLDELEGLIEQAVNRRMVSDVPLGVLLSGGIDSTIVAALMVRQQRAKKDSPDPSRILSFSIGFADSPESEHEEARAAARHLGTTHIDAILNPDITEIMPRIAAHLDEPLGDSSCLPTWCLAEMVRRHATVVLTGDGGDELFGGYQRYLETYREEVTLAHKARYLLHRKKPWNPADAYCSPRFWMFQPEDVRGLTGCWPAEADEVAEAMRTMMIDRTMPVIHRMRSLDGRTYLPGAVLAKVDRMFMAHSVEARCPLLDPAVADFAAALSRGDCISRETPKVLLRKLAQRYIPHEWTRRPKRGFGLPSSGWNTAAMLDMAHDLLLGAESVSTSTVLDCQAVGRWLNAQRLNDAAQFSVFRMWTVLMLELWLRAHAAAKHGAGRSAWAASEVAATVSSSSAAPVCAPMAGETSQPVL